MSSKPAKVCKLEKGKIIDAQKGLVDTFNWIVDWVSNFSVDKKTGLKLDRNQSDHPKLMSDKEKLSVVCGKDSNIVMAKSGNTITVDVYYV